MISSGIFPGFSFEINQELFMRFLVRFCPRLIQELLLVFLNVFYFRNSTLDSSRGVSSVILLGLIFRFLLDFPRKSLWYISWNFFLDFLNNSFLEFSWTSSQVTLCWSISLVKVSKTIIKPKTFHFGFVMVLTCSSALFYRMQTYTYI